MALQDRKLAILDFEYLNISESLALGKWFSLHGARSCSGAPGTDVTWRDCRSLVVTAIPLNGKLVTTFGPLRRTWKRAGFEAGSPRWWLWLADIPKNMYTNDYKIANVYIYIYTFIYIYINVFMAWCSLLGFYMLLRVGWSLVFLPFVLKVWVAVTGLPLGVCSRI